MTGQHTPARDPLIDMELLAVELAQIAGTEIAASLGSTLAVRYKTLGAGPDAPVSLRDPVSEVDTRVEAMIRQKVGERFPDHSIVGEEFTDTVGRNGRYVWAVDPIDGTANFVNGFPLFAGAIGLLRDGIPVVGAVWCSTSHALRPGVYHAREGGPLAFDGAALPVVPNPEVRRRLCGMPDAAIVPGLAADSRKTGSAAIECAFVAAGLLQAAWFARPNIWDVAAGIPLVRASGLDVATRGPAGWKAFSAFEVPLDPSNAPDYRQWGQALAIGDPASVAALCASV
jgi:myo-inositol-1(or 4)-monophosphatase